MLKKRILFVDDDQPLLDAMRRSLHAHAADWDMTFSSQPLAAWELLLMHPYDIVVSDVEMPVLDGLRLLERIRENEQTRDVHVIILTGLRTRDLKRRALELGAVDLLSKPVETEDLVARIRSVLQLKACQDDLRAVNQFLKQKVRQRARELEMSRIEIVWRLAKAAELRDAATGNHVVRVGCYSRILGEAIGLDADRIDNLFLAAPLHDIGKLGIPDAILLKPDALTPDEWIVMQRHCIIGRDILQGHVQTTMAFRAWENVNDFPAWEEFHYPLLATAACIALTHHERWDGTGYPQGLAGEQIPLEARIVGLADAFDALTSVRPYKVAVDECEALEIIREDAGRHFDPSVCEAFEASLDKIRLVRRSLADETHDPLNEEGCHEEYSVCR